MNNLDVAAATLDEHAPSFGFAEAAYNNLVRVLLINDIDAVNEFMNEVAYNAS